MPHTWLEYLRLKAIVSVIRLLVTWFATPSRPNDVFTLKARDGKRDIQVHVYRPKRRTTPSPVLLNWHGSAFVLPEHGSDDLFCRRVAEETSYLVLDASYALAPEYPFPAALEDVEDLILYTLRKSDLFDVDNIVLSGFSSGANLALSAAANPELNHIPPGSIRAIVAFYPPTNVTILPSEKRAPDGSTAMAAPAIANAFRASYMPPGIDPSDPRLSVIKAEPKNFPNDLLILTAEKDSLAPEAEELASILQSAGKTVVHKRFNNVGHAWDKNKDEASLDAMERNVAYAMVTAFLSDILTKTSH